MSESQDDISNSILIKKLIMEGLIEDEAEAVKAIFDSVEGDVLSMPLDMGNEVCACCKNKATTTILNKKIAHTNLCASCERRMK